MIRLPREKRARLLDGCQAALVWLAVLACVSSDEDVAGLAQVAMAAIALAAAFVALCPLPGQVAGACPPPVRPSGSSSTINKEDEPHVL